jgi:hypothetical protein
LHAWLNVVDMAAKDVSVERRNLEATVLQIVLKAVHYVYSRAVAVTVVKQMCLVVCEEMYVGVIGSVVVERCWVIVPLIWSWCKLHFSTFQHSRVLTVICRMKLVKTNIKVEDWRSSYQASKN